jgi:hypothetical protein
MIRVVIPDPVPDFLPIPGSGSRIHETKGTRFRIRIRVPRAGYAKDHFQEQDPKPNRTGPDPQDSL